MVQAKQRGFAGIICKTHELQPRASAVDFIIPVVDKRRHLDQIQFKIDPTLIKHFSMHNMRAFRN